MSTKKQILILGFGGTIAMTPSDHGLVPTQSIEEILVLVPTIADYADITFTQIENEDSTNIGPSHWSKLIKVVAGEIDNYDGILITHGTDTMAYTATALSFGLGQNLSKPIVFTGSQLPLVSFKTDARSNLERAVETLVEASKYHIGEVMIVFDDVVLRGNRTIKTSESKFKAFDSPAVSHLGEIDAFGISFIDNVRIAPNKPLDVRPQFDNNIISIELVPGLKPSMLQALVRGGDCHGILLKSLGAGNVPNLDEYSILPVIKEASDNNIPVLLSTKFVGGKVHSGIYEVSRSAIDAGAIPTGDLTDVAAQVKFMWALAQGKTSRQELFEFINKDFVGEISN